MQVSARILGKKYGLTGEEMNRVLLKLGFLEGSPGDYSLTEKALNYAVEKDYHSGTGGYSFYNRYWTTRTFDDSIKKVLDVTPELIKEVRDELAAARAARYAARAAASAEYLARQTAEKAALEAAKQSAIETEELIAKWKKAGKIGLGVGVSIIIIGYGIYKVTPKLKSWWNKCKHTSKERNINVKIKTDKN